MNPRSPQPPGLRQIARIVRDALQQGTPVEIDGLGTFLPSGPGGVRFRAQTKPRVFLAYVEEDLAIINRLYDALAKKGFRPWLDKKKLMPGQNWPRAIERAIETSDFFLACFSGRSSVKRGTFHSELRYALACAERIPLDEVFFVPVRLEPCDVPMRIARRIQYIDLFPDWAAGIEKILHALSCQAQRRKRKRLLLAG